MSEIVIIGAGVIGSSTAFHLAEQGARSVTVLDAVHAGGGMSSRSSALVRMHYTFEPEVRLAVESFAYFRNWAERVGRPSVFHPSGFVRLVPADELTSLQRNVEMQRACGANVQLIGADDLHELEPAWNVEDVVAAAYEPLSGYGDGAAVAGDFLSRARELGVEYRPNTRVRQLVVEGGRVQGVVTDDGVVGADFVVAATGVWTKPLLAKAGIEVPIETEYHEVAALERNLLKELPVRTACIDSVTQTYFRPETGGGVLIGDFLGRKIGVDPDAIPQIPEDESLAELVSRAARRVPALQEASLHRGVTGVYDMTPDARPLIGPLSELEGLFLAAGFSGTGFKISPAVGRAVAEWLLDGRSRTVDISAFRPSRFLEGRPIVSPYAYAAD